MKKFEINAFSIAEAKEKAFNMGINVIKNVTLSYNNQNPTDFDQFAEDMLKKNRLDNATGVGCIVVLEAGSADTRERPYSFVNHTAEGPLVKRRVFEIRKKSNEQVVGTAVSKAEASRKAKSMMKTIKEDLVCKQVYKVLGAHELAFELNYVPSKNTKEGKYIVFGN